MDDLIARLRERAADPKRRTDAPQSISLSGPGGTLATKFGGLGGGSSLGNLFSDLRRVVDANQAGRPIDADIAERVDSMASEMRTDSVTDLPDPATAATLDAAERRLGSRLPAELRRVYAEVADGGFGPGGGLLSVDRAVDEYLLLRSQPQGPRDQPWPEALLPVQVIDPGYETIDLATGRMVAWDPEELTERSGEKAWQASFSEIAPSLEAWLLEWVGARPAHEVEQERADASMIEDARRSRAMIAAMTPAERAAMGLPEVGWEQVVWGGIGLDEDDSEPGSG